MTAAPPSSPSIGYTGAVALVVANMVGTGVFTTLGLQAEVVPEPLALLALWLLGGLVALAGALCYAELAAALPRSGGEYAYLGRIYHPALGFAAGLVSLTVGFAAPVALAAMALGHYASVLVPVAPAVSAAVAVGLVTLAHAIDTRLGQRFHVVATGLKVTLVGVFCVAGLSVPPAVELSADWAGAGRAILSPGFAVALIYVAYAYSGWNAAVYVAEEVRDPQRVLPRSLLGGTLFVTCLYLVLNLVFLRTVPIESLAGVIEVGAASAGWVFGSRGAYLMSAMLVLLLLSTVSAMVWTGPRVLQAAASDLPRLGWLAHRTRRGAPVRAVVLQSGLALAFIATNTFEGVLTYAGFTLSLVAFLTVLGVVVLRRTAPGLHRPFRVPGYPLTPLIFLLPTAVAIAYAAQQRVLVAVASIATVLVAATLALGRGR